MKAEALRCRNVAGMLFNFIGNTVIHSCVKVELSYEIKNAPRGCAARGNVKMEKNRMEIVGMERNSEWKIERKEENGWSIQEIKQKIRKRRH